MKKPDHTNMDRL